MADVRCCACSTTILRLARPPATHFESVFACAKRAGYWDDSRVRINHVGFRVVLGVQEELMAAQTNVGMAGCIKYADLSHYR